MLPQMACDFCVLIGLPLGGGERQHEGLEILVAVQFCSLVRGGTLPPHLRYVIPLFGILLLEARVLARMSHANLLLVAEVTLDAANARKGGGGGKEKKQVKRTKPCPHRRWEATCMTALCSCYQWYERAMSDMR